MHLSYDCRAIIFFVYIFPAHYYISTYVVFVCFCVIYSFITAVCYYFRFLFLFSTILLSHIKVLYAFVFYPVAREYPRRNEKKMSIGGGWFIFTPCAGGLRLVFAVPPCRRRCCFRFGGVILPTAGESGETV